MGGEQLLQEISSRLHPHILLPTPSLPVLLWAADSSSSISTLGVAKTSPHGHDGKNSRSPTLGCIYGSQKYSSTPVHAKDPVPCQLQKVSLPEGQGVQHLFSETWN